MPTPAGATETRGVSKLQSSPPVGPPAVKTGTQPAVFKTTRLADIEVHKAIRPRSGSDGAVIENFVD